jgi:hypothetical protein
MMLRALAAALLLGASVSRAAPPRTIPAGYIYMDSWNQEGVCPNSCPGGGTCVQFPFFFVNATCADFTSIGGGSIMVICDQSTEDSTWSYREYEGTPDCTGKLHLSANGQGLACARTTAATTPVTYGSMMMYCVNASSPGGTGAGAGTTGVAPVTTTGVPTTTGTTTGAPTTTGQPATTTGIATTTGVSATTGTTTGTTTGKASNTGGSSSDAAAAHLSAAIVALGGVLVLA